jgi:hypothetical protein
MHAHALLKVAELDVLECESLVRETWERTTGAYIVELAELVSPGAALGYLGLHHRKPSQAPPKLWRGMTERSSRGYWHRPIAELREQARAELRAEAHAWRTGLPVELAALELAAAAPAGLRRVRSRPDRALLDPQGEPSWLSSPRKTELEELRRLRSQPVDVQARQVRESILHGDPAPAERPDSPAARSAS